MGYETDKWTSSLTTFHRFVHNSFPIESGRNSHG